MGDELNTSESDSRGRCVRHPAIRLRKKKLLGGWKTIIGHCPECCLDEMRRVRDEIGAEQDRADRHGGSVRKEKKKKKKRDKERRHRRSDDSISEVGSEGVQRTHNPMPHSVTSEATGSTAQNSSMDGNTIASEPCMRYQQQQQQLGGRDVALYHQQTPYHHSPQQSPSPVQRIMVLSMAFTDPQMGQTGTYTGQINSINHKPDGKGTVYFSNGNIAEGTWMNGVLVEAEDEALGGAGGGFGQPNYGAGRGGGGFSPPPPQANRSKPRSREARGDAPRSSRSQSRSRAPRVQRGYSNPPGFNANNLPTGNLDRLDQLGRAHRTSQPRSGSASVHSYNSRASSHAGEHGSSASVQGYGRGAYHGGAQSAIGRVGGGHDEVQRDNNGYRQQQQHPRPHR